MKPIFLTLALFICATGAMSAATSSIASGDNKDGALTSPNSDVWTVAADAGDFLLFRVTKLTNVTTNWGLSLTLTGPTGSTSLASSSTGGSSEAGISYRATAAGTFTLTVVATTGSTQPQSGTYRVSFVKSRGTFVVPPGDEGGALTNGFPHDGTIAVGDLDPWTVTVTAGDTMVVRMISTISNGIFSYQLDLYGPDGGLVNGTASGTGSPSSGLGNEATFKATLGGNYTFVVSAAGSGGKGTYRMNFLKIPGTSLVNAGDDGGALANGQNYTGTIESGDLDPWTLSANAGDAILVRIGRTSGSGEVGSGTAFNPSIRLFSPSGALLSEQRGYWDAIITFRATTTGSHTIVVSDGGNLGTQTGGYRLTYIKVPDAFVVPVGDEGGALTNGQNYEAAITLGDLDAWTVTARAGDDLLFRATKLTGGSFFSPFIFLLGPDGTPIKSTDQAATEVSLTYRTTTAGTYTVVVCNTYTSTSDVGTYRLVASGATQLVAPTIVTHPVAQTVAQGAAVSLSVAATGTGPLSYQWRRDGVNIVGATNATYSIASAQASSRGSYTVVVTNAAGSVTSNAASVAVNIEVVSRISNVSVRTTLAANQTLIVGLTMSGGAKSTLIRAVGPGLGVFGVTGFMPDPKLALFDGETQVDTNDNWGGAAALSTAFAGVGAFGLPPASLDAALLRSFNGGRTAQISGASGGNVLVEAYDSGSGNIPRLVNVSARNRVGTGADVLIAGLTIAGTGPKTVLIRAVGPTLSVFGVPGTLSDPKLEIYSGSTKVNENDTWAPSLVSTFSAVGAFQLAAGSKDAALVLDLQPGGYTVQVSGADGGTGEALIEIYELQF